MKPTLTTPDEFFPDNVPVAFPAEEHTEDQLVLPSKVIPRPAFPQLAVDLTESLLVEQSAIEAYVRIRNVADILDLALAILKERAILSLEGTTGEILGAKVIIKSLPRKYSYTDATLDALESEKNAIETKIKARKRFLENLDGEVADTTTGEIIQPARCISSGSTIQVTF